MKSPVRVVVTSTATPDASAARVRATGAAAPLVTTKHATPASATAVTRAAAAGPSVSR